MVSTFIVKYCSVKNLLISGPMHFKLGLFKGQLIFINEAIIM